MHACVIIPLLVIVPFQGLFLWESPLPSLLQSLQPLTQLICFELCIRRNSTTVAFGTSFYYVMKNKYVVLIFRQLCGSSLPQRPSEWVLKGCLDWVDIIWKLIIVHSWNPPSTHTSQFPKMLNSAGGRYIDKLRLKLMKRDVSLLPLSSSGHPYPLPARGPPYFHLHNMSPLPFHTTGRTVIPEAQAPCPLHAPGNGLHTRQDCVVSLSIGGPHQFVRWGHTTDLEWPV